MVMEASASRHRRSNSDPIPSKEKKCIQNKILEAAPHRTKLKKKKKMGLMEDCVQPKQRKSPKTEVQKALKQEILELQDMLQNQFVVRRALEKALSSGPFHRNATLDKSIPTPAKELIKEIAVLELEVVYLEQYLLSLYRKIFDQRALPQTTMDERFKVNITGKKAMKPEIPGQETISHKQNLIDHSINLPCQQYSTRKLPKKCSNGQQEELELFDSRCHSSITQHSFVSTPAMKSIARAVDSYHSLPLSILEQAQNHTSEVISLDDHLETQAYSDVSETPNRLSEEIIRSISSIYCELADPPLRNPDYPSSPVSFASSQTEIPSQGQDDTWSSQYGNFSSFNSSLEIPVHIGDSKEFNVPYCTMAKVHWISRDPSKLKDIQHKIQAFRSLVSQLEMIDPTKMKHEEKLAFWINIHNALAMHALLVYGIPRNNIKRMSLLLKAAYNVGDQTVNVDMIQSSILGCRLLRPRHWLRMLFPLKMKFKDGDTRKAYAIDHPEPRLYFALCSGSSSDPAVRVYTPKRVFEDLENAKEEYIQSTFFIQKENKLLLPNIVESFAKDLNVCPVGLLEMIEHLLPDSLRKNIQQYQHRKSGKRIEWIPHNFTFRYVFSKELS